MLRPWTSKHVQAALLILLSTFCCTRTCYARNQGHKARSIDELRENDLRTIIDLDPEPWQSVDQGHLGAMLIPRPSGSQNNTDVRNYLKEVLDKLGWHTEEDSFMGTTPIGDIEFTNLIATFKPEAPTKLVLAAHFDSKYFDSYPANQFVGATDSAAPCATLLDIAEALTPLLKAKEELIQEDEYDGDEEWAYTTLQLVFFDGEEAFHDWTATDSIYGARHLAERWSETYLPPDHPVSLQSRRYDPIPTVLSTIEHLVLLDLLGATDPSIISYYAQTKWLHTHLKSVESRVKSLGMMGLSKGSDWFKSLGYGGVIDDDHRPFLEKGVSILHLITNPFPGVWHTIKDDATALDMPTLRRWNAIMRIFVVEYLGLPIPVAEKDIKRQAVPHRSHDL